MVILPPRALRVLLRATSCLLLLPAAASADQPPPGDPPAVRRLPVARILDIPAEDRLFQRGLPVGEGSFSPEGFHYSYLHLIPGGFLRRKPQRCTFLLDLQSGDVRPIKTPKGRATRVAGWDPTGRYLLIETEDTSWLSPITGSWSTYHYIFDVVTSEFPKRRPFTGLRDGQTFLWKHEGTYHGTWDTEYEDEARVRPMYEGELAQRNQRRGEDLSAEDKRRLVMAERLAVGLAGEEPRSLAEVLPRLDRTWTQRGQRDPVVSDLFGERPTVFQREHTGRPWAPVLSETEYLAVLDHGVALLTGQGGAQYLFQLERGELLPLPPPPDGWPEELRDRWDRQGAVWDELDPLPRDLQYRRDWDEAQGVATYFNYVTPDVRHALLLHSFGPSRRVLRVVELPKSWRPAP